MTVRDATRDDLPTIVDIYNSTVASRMVTADTEPVSVESRVAWFDAHNQSRRPLWVLLDDKQKITGWISYQSFYGRPAYNGTAEVSIYLHPDERGKGLGKQALQYALDEAPRLGIKTVLGYIFAHNEPSLNLFRHFGFNDWAMMPNIAELDGQDRSLIIVGKRLVP
jgi:L-amino acid N-acyltransferase YncA